MKITNNNNGPVKLYGVGNEPAQSSGLPNETNAPVIPPVVNSLIPDLPYSSYAGISGPNVSGAPPTDDPKDSEQSASTGTESAPSSAPETQAYLDYLKSLPDELKNVYSEQISAIDASNKAIVDEINDTRNSGLDYASQARENAYVDAATTRQRNIVNANSAYEQNKATYGANAEAIASMGLTGGGYSDYLNAQAYAGYRDDIQTANAQEVNSKRLADDAYDEMSYKVNSKADELIIQANANAENAKLEAKSAYDAAILENKKDIASYDEKFKTDSNTYYEDVITNSRYDPSYYTQEDYDDMAKNGVLTADDAAKAKAEQNRNVYNGVVDMLNSGNVDNIAGAFADAEALLRDGNIDQATYNEIAALLNNSSQGVTYQYKSGKITATQYVEKMKAIGAASSGTVSGGWTIQGLGTGRNNDDVDITIGSTSRGEGLGEFDLLCGDAISSNSAIISELNKLATGDASKAPITEGTWLTWLHGDTANSDDTPGKLVVYNGGLYLYGTKGWVPVKNDNDNSSLDKCIAAFLQSTSRSNIPGKSK